MARPKKEVEVAQEQPAIQADIAGRLAEAIIQGIEEARPKRITITNRKRNTPWTPKDGSKKLTLKRKMYQHGLRIKENTCTNEEIDLMNKIKPNVYCNGFITVTRRRDRGINIDYKIKTASDKLKLVNQFGITSFASLLRRIIDEGENPATYKSPDELD